MDDLISRQAAIDAMANTLWHYPNECYRNLNEYEFAKGLSELGLKSVPSAQPYTEAELQKMQELEQAEMIKAYECGRASAQPEWNNHTVACLLAELFDDTCACNYNGIDEWLPEKCEVIDACPNPVGVACWEQYLAWKPCPEPYREDGAE